MKTMYRWRKWDDGIDPVEVVRETPKCVFVMQDTFGGRQREDRRAKDSEYDHYCETFDAAKAALVADRQKLVRLAEGRLSTARENLANVEAIEPPESPR